MSCSSHSPNLYPSVHSPRGYPAAGVFANVLMPGWLQTILLTILLLIVIRKTLANGLKMWRSEQKDVELKRKLKQDVGYREEDSDSDSEGVLHEEAYHMKPHRCLQCYPLPLCFHIRTCGKGGTEMGGGCWPIEEDSESNNRDVLHKECATWSLTAASTLSTPPPHQPHSQKGSRKVCSHLKFQGKLGEDACRREEVMGSGNEGRCTRSPATEAPQVAWLCCCLDSSFLNPLPLHPTANHKLKKYMTRSPSADTTTTVCCTVRPTTAGAALLLMPHDNAPCSPS